jgi:hypothetical protein
VCATISIWPDEKARPQVWRLSLPKTLTIPAPPEGLLSIAERPKNEECFYPEPIGESGPAILSEVDLLG